MILRDYLIALGFKIDENGWRGFNDKLAVSARNAARLGATVAGAATEIAVATDKIAKQYEELYYVQQRTGSAITGIKAQAFAFGQVGSNAEAARASIEGMAAASRLNPGVRAMFSGIGVDMADPVKGVGQLVDVMKSKFGEAGYFVAAKFAGMAGMDETTFRQVWMNREKLRAQEQEHLRRQKEAGIDAQKFAADSVRFGDSLRSLEARWGLLIDRVAIGWLPTLQKVVDTGGDFISWVTRADVASRGWLGTIGSIVAALGALRAAGAVLGTAGRLLGITSGAAAGGVAARSLGMRALLLRALGPAGAFAWAMGAGGEAQGATMPGGAGRAHPSDAPASGSALTRQDMITSPSRQDQDEVVPSSADKKPSALARSIATTSKNLGIDPIDLATVVSYETGGTFDKWKRGPTTQHGEHRGLIQWGEPQRARYGVTKDSTVDEQMAAVEKYLRDAGVRPGAKLLDIYSAVNAGRVGRNDARDANNGGAPGTVADKVAGMEDHRANARMLLGDTVLSSSGGGGAVVSINQRNNISVSGVSDPRKAADMTADAQQRVNGDIVRNTRSVFQ